MTSNNKDSQQTPVQQKRGRSFKWTTRCAKEWSKLKFQHLFQGQQFETTAGVYTITGIVKCKGHAYAIRSQGYLPLYDWVIKLRWTGTPRDAQNFKIPGTIEISNFSNRSSINNVKITVQSVIQRPELIEAFRSVVLSRLIDQLGNYVHLLYGVLAASSCHSVPAHGIKTDQSEVGGTESMESNGGGMRVGPDFQAQLPSLLSAQEQQGHAIDDKALLVWSPPNRLDQDDIVKYVETSRDDFNYAGEQALGLLFWHQYDVEKSLQDLRNFAPAQVQWTPEDKELFKQAFKYYGKSFHLIQQLLPDKSLSNIIVYYYQWKKSKDNKDDDEPLSVADKRCKNKLSQGNA